MGLETGLPRLHNDHEGPLVVGLQPIALVDRVARVDWSLLESIPGERGGSQRVTAEELKYILKEVNSRTLPQINEPVAVRTLAGGSVANTIRGLAGGFRVSAAIVGARGDDEQGLMFSQNMKLSGVLLSQLRVKEGPTGQCACLVDVDGNRTMRPCLSDAVRLQANELSQDDFRGAQWVVLNGYGFYGEELVERAVDLAKKEGAQVSMDLSSFEVVRNFRPRLMKLLASGKIDLCIANEDEARELIMEENHSDPEWGLAFLAKYCSWAVVMLGSNGCLACHGNKIVRMPAIPVMEVVDTTGAGDLFASGFLYGMINQLSLEDCCKIGCCSGAAVVRALGGELTTENLAWMCQQLKFWNLPSEGYVHALNPYSVKLLPINTISSSDSVGSFVQPKF